MMRPLPLAPKLSIDTQSNSSSSSQVQLLPDQQRPLPQPPLTPARSRRRLAGPRDGSVPSLTIRKTPQIAFDPRERAWVVHSRERSNTEVKSEGKGKGKGKAIDAPSLNHWLLDTAPADRQPKKKTLYVHNPPVEEEVEVFVDDGFTHSRSPSPISYARPDLPDADSDSEPESEMEFSKNPSPIERVYVMAYALGHTLSDDEDVPHKKTKPRSGTTSSSASIKTVPKRPHRRRRALSGGSYNTTAELQRLSQRGGVVELDVNGPFQPDYIAPSLNDSEEQARRVHVAFGSLQPNRFVEPRAGDGPIGGGASPIGSGGGTGIGVLGGLGLGGKSSTRIREMRERERDRSLPPAILDRGRRGA